MEKGGKLHPPTPLSFSHGAFCFGYGPNCFRSWSVFISSWSDFSLTMEHPSIQPPRFGNAPPRFSTGAPHNKVHGGDAVCPYWGSETPILGRSNPHAGEIADLRRGEALPMRSEHEVRPVAAPCAAADHSADGLLHFQLSKIEPQCAIATRKSLN